MGAMSPRPIWTNGMAQHNGLIVRGHPYLTGHVFCLHIIINMEIDDDMMAILPNNPPHFGHLWSTSVRMVGEVAGLNGSE